MQYLTESEVRSELSKCRSIQSLQILRTKVAPRYKYLVGGVIEKRLSKLGYIYYKCHLEALENALDIQTNLDEVGGIIKVKVQPNLNSRNVLKSAEGKTIKIVVYSIWNEFSHWKVGFYAKF